MKKLATATAALLFSATTALGGTLVLAEPEPVVYTPAPAPAYNWTGGYAGVQLGAYNARHRMTFELETIMSNPDSSGLHGGLYAGYNWHGGGSTVFGVEGELNAFSGSGEASLFGPPDFETEIPNEVWYSRVRSDAALRLRAGVLADENTLLYATLGVAAARYRFSVEDLPVPRDEHSGTRTGWTAGLGIEHAMQNGWNVRADYRFSDYGTETYTDELPGTIEAYSRLRTHQIRLGVAMRF